MYKNRRRGVMTIWNKCQQHSIVEAQADQNMK